MVHTELSLRTVHTIRVSIKDATTAKNIQVPNPRPPTWASEISFIWPAASVMAKKNDNVTLECIFSTRKVWIYFLHIRNPFFISQEKSKRKKMAAFFM